MLDKILTVAPLAGSRTYIISGVLFITAVANFLVGDIGFAEFIQQLPMILGSLVPATLRAGMKK